MSRALCWIRRDLRLSDHRALFEACNRHDEVAIAFVFDTNILDELSNREDRRVTFIMRSLVELNQKLELRGSKLIVLHGVPQIEIPNLASSLDVDEVVVAHDFEPAALERDAHVKALLAQKGIEFRTVKDQVVFEKGEVLSQSNTPFRVFTPYSRRWLELLSNADCISPYSPDLSKLMPSTSMNVDTGELSLSRIGFIESEPWIAAGEEAAVHSLQAFEERIDRYGESRDIPSLNGTSFLSVHLRFGTISIREAVRTALKHDSAGARKWLTELIWRDFYQDVLANHPQVVSTTFDPTYATMQWPGSIEHFEAWKAGTTGYPIVDAAMRCFAQTGWMHNRLRMIVASFLTKDLLVDYKLGEKYFADNLIDFDLASNNGGWQWAASVGCDAQPYFRIFNPYLQSKKFDSEGKFIRHWVPELNELSDIDIHCPTAFDAQACGYPLPIVNHDEQRKLAVEMFQEARKDPAQLN